MAGPYNRLHERRSPVASPISPVRPPFGQGYAPSDNASQYSLSAGSGGGMSNDSQARATGNAGRLAGLATTDASLSAGQHELGPYSPLSRRNNTSNKAGSYETDNSSSQSPTDRLLKDSPAYGNTGALGYASDAYAIGKPEPDDYLHDPRNVDARSHRISLRGFLNILTLVLLVFGLLTLFAGYPIIYHFVTEKADNNGAYGLGGTNGTGQIASLSALRPMIDLDTPPDSKTWTSPISNVQYNLQFSDEFNQEGRTFWKGDDQYWEAVDIWYGGTQDYEWYSPENVNTTGGALVLTMTDHPSHNLNFQSGMLQSWNKLCFTGGYIEYSLIQPGLQTTQGYWPGAWIMGNLGRPGYMATTDGMWPYTYQGCDTGILANQTNAKGGPEGAVDSSSDSSAKGQLSKLPGMRTPSCTCSGEDHPGPKNSVGRSAPEIDILEAQIQSHDGEKASYASQSMQAAPYDDAYNWIEDAATIYGDNTKTNTYKGGPYQETLSSVSLIPERNFMDYDAPEAEKWVKFGLEWVPDYDLNGGGSLTWFVDGKATWKLTGKSLPADKDMDISQRNIPVEAMAIVMNLGISQGFQNIDFDPDTGVKFPAQMKFDYVRVYQQKGKEQMSCDPEDYPTSDYINRHLDVYNNPNLTVWSDTKYAWPKNKLTGC